MRSTHQKIQLNHIANFLLQMNWNRKAESPTVYFTGHGRGTKRIDVRDMAKKTKRDATVSLFLRYVLEEHGCEGIGALTAYVNSEPKPRPPADPEHPSVAKGKKAKAKSAAPVVLGPDGQPVKRPRGRPRKNPLPVAAPVEAAAQEAVEAAEEQSAEQSLFETSPTLN